MKPPTITDEQASVIAREVKAFNANKNPLTGKVMSDQPSPFASLKLNKADVAMVIRHMVS